ncbi:hypothetical protein [Azospirillum sp. SYSU D00513]|uniref:hypothetical protein n=1 Tax=Azospirillum sp. SYSU D00513 TaxID=2812561 RepID=UPI0032B5CACB
MRAVLSLTVAALLSISSAISPAMSQETRGQELAKDPNVQQNQPDGPNAQGVRSPSAGTAENTDAMDLQQALAAVRKAPPDLQGRPVPRPNSWASSPDNPQEPTRSGNPSDLSSQELK